MNLLALVYDLVTRIWINKNCPPVEMQIKIRKKNPAHAKKWPTSEETKQKSKTQQSFKKMYNRRSLTQIIKGNEQTMREKFRIARTTMKMPSEEIGTKQIIQNCVKVIKNYLLHAILMKYYFKATFIYIYMNMQSGRFSRNAASCSYIKRERQRWTDGWTDRLNDTRTQNIHICPLNAYNVTESNRHRIR